MKQGKVSYFFLRAMLWCFTLVGSGWLLACVFFSAPILNLVGGNVVAFGFLIAAGAGLAIGGGVLLRCLSADRKTFVSIETAQLRARVEAKKIQLQHYREDEETYSQKTARKAAELDAKEFELEQQRIRIGSMEIETAAA